MNLPKTKLTEDEPIRCVICKSYCDDSGLCDEHKYDEQKTELTNDKIDEILIPMLFGEEGMAKQDGSSLMGQIVYSQNSKLSKSREKITHLIHQAEITRARDEQNRFQHSLAHLIVYSKPHAKAGLRLAMTMVDERIEALEKEIV